MDIEQLKLVLTTLSQMGEAGKEMFIWWLMLDKLLPAIAWLSALAAIVHVGLQFISSQATYDQFCEFRDKLGIGSSGYLSDRERRETSDRINKLIDKHMKQL